MPEQRAAPAQTVRAVCGLSLIHILPPTRTQDEASRGASTPKHAVSHSRNTASVGVKKFFQNGRHGAAIVSGWCAALGAMLCLPFWKTFFTPTLAVFLLWLAAVSYTHLDVYKRQTWRSTI